MARTADIHVRARRGKTTQELHRDALQDRMGSTIKLGTNELNTEDTAITFSDNHSTRCDILH